MVGSATQPKVPPGYEDRILAQGNSCQNCGWQYTNAYLKTNGQYFLNGYVVQPGDKVFVRQYQTTGSEGGFAFGYTDGTWSGPLNQRDQDGQLMYADLITNQWHVRQFDMTPVAGKTINNVLLITNGSTLPSPWAIYYQDLTLVGADGVVHKVYSHDKTVTVDLGYSTGLSAVSYTVDHGLGPNPDTSTTYYSGDQLGSARMTTNYNGYPTWQNTYYPWGVGYNPQPTITRWKFAGMERDPETVYDYTMFRFYDAPLGRWFSPDPLGGNIGDPQSLNRYAYVGNNPLNAIDPFGLYIVDCSWDNCGPSWRNGGAGNYGGASTAFSGTFNTISAGNPNFNNPSAELAYLRNIYGSGVTSTSSGFDVFLKGPSDRGTCNIGVFCFTAMTSEIMLSISLGGDGSFSAASFAANNASLTTPRAPRPPKPADNVVQQNNGKSIPNVPPEWGFCSSYRDGTGAGEALYRICMNTPNSPWANCVRGRLRQQFVPNDNPLSLVFRYVVWDHPKDFLTCGVQ